MGNEKEFKEFVGFVEFVESEEFMESEEFNERKRNKTGAGLQFGLEVRINKKFP
jgi:hypothetical protein